MKEVVVSVPLPVSLVPPGCLDDPMLFTATNIRMRIAVRRAATHRKHPWSTLLQKATEALRQKYPDIKLEGWSITVLKNTPTTAGSTVAVLVGAIGSLLYANRNIWNPLAIQEIAYHSIKDAYQEAPAMVAACVAGGIIWSRRELPFLTSTWQLPIRLPSALQKFSLSFIRTERNNGKGSPKAIAIALKEGDAQALRRYYRSGVVSLPGDTALWYEKGNTHELQAIEIGGDGIRLESK